MNAVIVSLTARQVLGRKRVFFLALGALIPVAIALIYVVGAPKDDPTPQEFAAGFLYEGLILFVLLPLCALVLGTSVLGGEIEDGTAVYLLSKPVPRWQIITSKLLVSWLATTGLVLAASIVAGVIGLWGEDGDGIIAGFTAGIILGALAYSCVFVLLSIVTSRALIAGLVYVFVWEGLVTALFSGTRILSIRQYSLGVAGGIADLPRDFESEMGALQAIILLVIVSAAAASLAVRRLQRFEIGETT